MQPTGQDMNGITHTNGNDKMYVSLNWTAPADGTGPVTFRYAGVVVRDTYWANQMGPMLTGEFIWLNLTHCHPLG